MKTKKFLSVVISLLMSLSFVMFYTISKNYSIEIIHSFATEGKLYNQNDSKWKNVKFTKYSTSGNDMYTSGCGIFSFCNAIYALNSNQPDAVEVATWAVNNGSYQPGNGGMYRQSFYNQVQSAYGDRFNFKIDGQYYGKITDSRLISHLKNGGVAAVHVNNHFMAITGYNASNNTYHVIESAVYSGRGLQADSWVSASKMSSGNTNVYWYALISNKSISTTCNIELTGFQNPQKDYVHTPGANCGLYGTITSNHTLKHVWGGVYKLDGTPTSGSSTTCDDYPNSTSYSLRGKFNNSIIFDDIPVGSYYFSISAEDNDGFKKELIHNNFTVGNPIWYSGLNPVNLGDSFDAVILNKNYWIPIRANSSTNVVLHKEEWKNNEMWRFTRQSDGSYKIVNFDNGLCMDADCSGTKDGTNIGTVASNDMPAQRWFLYENNGGYVLRPAYGDIVMDLNGNKSDNDTNIHLWTHHGKESQTFSVYNNGVANYAKPSPSVPKVTVKGESSISVTWNRTGYTDKYIIYRSTDNSTWSKISEVTSTEYTDTGLSQNTKYYYKYESVNRFYTVSSDSSYGTTLDKTAPVITRVESSDITISGFKLKADASDTAGLKSVTANVWTWKGYDVDGKNLSLVKSGDTWSCDVKVSDFNKTYGAYYYQIIATDINGNVTKSDIKEVKVGVFTVTFDPNGGTVDKNNQLIVYNYKYSEKGKLPTPTKKNYSFDGWYTDKTGGTKITNDTKVSVTANQTLFAHWTEEIIKGDCNNDGAFNVSDVVLLQKWLLADNSVTLNNWKNADLCEDNRLDVFDLVMMKKQLIGK